MTTLQALKRPAQGEAYLKVARQLYSGSIDPLVDAPMGPLPERARLEDRIEAFLQDRPGATAAVPVELREELRRVIATLYEGAPQSASGWSSPALEMVVVADGARPIFFFEGGRLKKGAGNGTFVDLVVQNASAIELATQSIGRIESDIRPAPSWTDRWFAGSAFRVGGDLAMTNRHVIEQMVNEPTSAWGPFTLNGDYWINFDAEFGAPGRKRFRIAQVIMAGEAYIGGLLDLSHLDLALLRLGAPEDAGTQLPPPLSLAKAPPAVGEPIYVSGYPGRPKLAGGGTPGSDSEVEDVLIQLFDQRYGGKRCASGEVDARPGFPEDAKRWALKHDASTLAGNSGSPLVSLSSGAPRVVGLHFGGVSRVTNYAHAFAQIADELAGHDLQLV